MRTARFWAIPLAAVLWLAAAVLLWRTAVPADLELPELNAREVFGARQIDRSGEYERGLRLFWLGALLAELAVLALAVVLARRRRGGILAGMAIGAATLAAVWLVRLPFVLGAHWWRRRYGISRADYATILVDPWLERIGMLVAACAAIGLLMVLARRLSERWWLVGGPAFAALTALFLLF
jgi:hypothetical protein